jgi:putative metallohydrolase (TIGR04338 family)
MGKVWYNQCMNEYYGVRDSQRSKVYEAERVIWHRGVQFSNLQEVDAYVQRICKSAYWRKLRGAYYVKVKDGRRRRSACAFDWGTIALPRWSRQEAVILHELTHTLVNFNNDRNVAWHGKEFASTYLKLVKRYMGKEAHAMLKQSFKDNHVHYIVR